MVGCMTTIIARATELLEKASTMMGNTRRETAFGKELYTVKHFHSTLYMYFRIFLLIEFPADVIGYFQRKGHSSNDRTHSTEKAQNNFKFELSGFFFSEVFFPENEPFT